MTATAASTAEATALMVASSEATCVAAYNAFTSACNLALSLQADFAKDMPVLLMQNNFTENAEKRIAAEVTMQLAHDTYIKAENAVRSAHQLAAIFAKEAEKKQKKAEKKQKKQSKQKSQQI